MLTSLAGPGPVCLSAGFLRCFLENLALLRLKQAWRAALQLDERRYWLALSNKVRGGLTFTLLLIGYIIAASTIYSYRTEEAVESVYTPQFGKWNGAPLF